MCWYVGTFLASYFTTNHSKYVGQICMMHRNTIPGSCLSHRFVMYLTYQMFHHFHLGNIHFRFTVITVLCICHFSLFSKSKQSWGFIYEIYHILLSNLSVEIVNSLKPEKAVQLLADDLFKHIYLNEKSISYSIHNEVFSGKMHHWLRSWLGAEQALSHYQNRWWTSLTHCGIVTPYGDIDLGQRWFS